MWMFLFLSTHRSKSHRETMLLWVSFIILGLAVVTHASQPAPQGLHFVGVGYNLLTGNPEGDDSLNGGVDPGLLTTKKIFKLTYDTNKLSVDLKYKVPDQVSFAPRLKCVYTTKKEVISGSRSYQQKLGADVKASGKCRAGRDWQLRP